jgi:riboflavin biosynthesis pyrimidine reductase
VLEAPSGADGVDARWLIDELGQRGWELILSEGGPHLMSDLVAAGLLDELFLTFAPQLAGRSAENPRLALIEGHEFSVTDAPWAELVDVRSAGAHLFTRYRFTDRERYE